MNEVFKEIGALQNNRWFGWSGKALVSQINPDGTATARNDWYKPIIVKDAELGELVDVKVKHCTYYDLRA